jgi:hypothetical protein
MTQREKSQIRHLNPLPFELRCHERRQTTDVSNLRPGWVRFRFLIRGSHSRHEEIGGDGFSCVLRSETPLPDEADIELDIRADVLMATGSAILKRRVFSVPRFCDGHDIKGSPLEATVRILRAVGRRSDTDRGVSICEPQLFFENVARMIMLYWPNSDTAEIELCENLRPPAALRQALAFLSLKNGMIDSTEAVAKESGLGQRSLEILFSEWLGLGIARYAKMLRLKALLEQHKKTRTDLSHLAGAYNFSNVTRLRQDLSALAEINSEDLAPESFYLRLAHRGESSAPFYDGRSVSVSKK